MKTVYIDYTHSISTEGVKFHGGGNYTKRILLLLNEMKATDLNIIILWPKSYVPQNKEEIIIRNSDVFHIIEIDYSVDEVEFEKSSRVFFPLLPVKKLCLAKKIREKNPDIKIYVTIHGLRLLDLKVDRYDQYYKNTNNIFYRIVSKMGYELGCYAYSLFFKRCIKYFDKVFTVSNFSLQQIIKQKKVNFICYYYQGILSCRIPIKNKFQDEYVLFVSGNRPEKNFMRALEAFLEYKKNKKNSLYLYVTGIKEDLKKLILQKYVIDKSIIEKWVVFFGYVDTDILNDLCKQCKFFLYTSKSEGFGIPVMEACLNEKPIVASYVTSIPEVVGSAAYYVNPYSVESIMKGIEYMNQEKNLQKYMKRIEKKKEILEMAIKLDNEALIEEILE